MARALKIPEARTYVGLGVATKLYGLSNVTILRLALLGDLPYQISPDRKPMFPVKDLERLRDAAAAHQAQTAGA